MNAEQLAELKDQLTSITTAVVKGLVQDLKEELRTEQQLSMAATESKLSEAVEKLSKKVDEMEKTLGTSSFVNRVFEDSTPVVCSSSSTITSTSIITSTVSTSNVVSLVGSIPAAITSFEVPTGHFCNYPAPTSNAERNQYRSPQFATSTCTANIYSQPLVVTNEPWGSHSSRQTAFEFQPRAPPQLSPVVPSATHSPDFAPPNVNQSTSHATMNNLGCSLAPFDGSVSWSDYRTQFEIVARRCNWSKQDKADAMATQLRGNALSVLSVFPRDRPIQYHDLVSLLEQRFGVDAYSCQVQFYSRMQGPKESFANFALELQRLATIAFPSCPTDVVDRMATLRFLEGLRDNELRTLAKVRGPKTLHEAVTAAQELSIGIGTGRNVRVYLTQTPVTRPNSRRRRRRSNNSHPSPERGVSGTIATTTPPPALYDSFIPAASNIATPFTSAVSGNISPSTLRGASR